MSVLFKTIGSIEKTYAFEDAIIDKDMYNGTFGEVEDGKFVAKENATKVIMQKECGDDAGMDKYLIKAGSHVRVLDMAVFAEQFQKFPHLHVIGYPLPAEFVVGDKLASNAEGKLVVGASAAPYLEVKEILGRKAGAEVAIVME